MTQSVTREGDRGHFGYMPWRWTDIRHTPSWKRHGEGTAALEVRCAGGRISLVAEEASGSRSRKVVMLSLDETSSRELFDYLKEHYAE